MKCLKIVLKNCFFFLSGKIYVIKTLFLFIIPFAMIVLMYGSMLLTIAKTKRSLGRFLVLSTAIVGTNLLCFTPTLTNSFMDMDMSYMTTQILFVTIWYLNGIFNPLIYFLFHPKTNKLYLYFETCLALMKQIGKIQDNGRYYKQ